MLISLKSLMCEVKLNCDWPCKASNNKCDKILTISVMNIFYISIDRTNVLKLIEKKRGFHVGRHLICRLPLFED